MADFTVGSLVRLVGPDNSRRVTIACLNDDGTADAFVETHNQSSEEIIQDSINIQVSSLHPLQPFESAPLKDITPKDHKRHGNVLFKLRDYIAADELYAKGEHALVQPVSVGAIVGVPAGNDGWGSIAMVSSVEEDGSYADLMCLLPLEHEDEEVDNVPVNSLFTIAAQQYDRKTQVQDQNRMV
jgi:hypothetical protein